MCYKLIITIHESRTGMKNEDMDQYFHIMIDRINQNSKQLIDRQSNTVNTTVVTWYQMKYLMKINTAGRHDVV